MNPLPQRVSIDPNVCFGKPCIRGTRIWVSLILDFLASGTGIEEILVEYPQLTEEDVRAAIAYGAKMSRERYVDISAEATGLHVYPRSVVEVDGTTFFLGRGPEGKVLGIIGDTEGFSGTRREETLLCPLTAANAAALRSKLPWLRPQMLGLKTTAGCGDRLGSATPGHIHALRRVGGLLPILAQQSMRENARTGRTPQEVVDDATWGVFQEDWREPWGADADHLKTTQDVDVCVEADYTFYTVDPRDHVDNAAHTDSVDALRDKFDALPWNDLLDLPDRLRGRYVGHRFWIETFFLEFDETALLRAACKYEAAILHTARMYRHLTAAAGERPFELEVSVDEADTPTSPLEHFFIATELRRLGVEWISLAPRYIGRFEKGVDYIGDLAQFEADFAQHAAIARVVGPYKLSLHSGSDKFSVYPIAARQAKGLVHLKTAGTSYLEALRAIAPVEPGLFRSILALAHEQYGEDKATYHVSADPAKVPLPDELADSQLSGVLDLFDGRQLLHVTYGSALEEYGEELVAALDAHEEEHYQALETHFVKHLQPFVA